MSRKKQQNQGKKSGLRRLLLLALVLAILLGAIAYRWSPDSFDSLERIREQGQRDPIAALKRLDAKGDTSRDSRLLRCQLLAASRHWEQAEQAFERVTEPELCSQDRLIELATVAIESGVYSLADKVLEAVYRQGDCHPTLLRTMIDVKHQLGFDQEVLPLCQEASVLAPLDPYPWQLAAQIYHHAEKIDLAIAAYQESLLRDLSEADARYTRLQIADLAIYAGDLDTAAQQLDRLAAQPAVGPEVGLLRAKLLHRQGSFDASLQVLDELLAAQPDMVAALLERGVLQLERENLEQAASDLKRAVGLAPENYTAHYKLGLAYRRMEQPDLARQHLERSSLITDRISQEKLQAEEQRRAQMRVPAN